MANKPRLNIVDPSKVASGNDLSGRGFVSPEELSILVELTSTLRSRSFIENDTNNNEATVTNNSNETSKPIGFLEGTNVGGRRSLTTNYTEVNTNLSVDGDNSLEALGIESINIKFDTAYTPNIQIKFIDVRGHAVLGQGNDSRYRMFFDLPYPIFNLTVKGFYGKPVTYCLHLTKWNASFNSSTGNFEIDTNFIGYTYALLTDCIIGLMRAVPYTTAGKEVIADRLDADTFTTIDELIDKIQKVGDEIDGIRTNSENVKQLNSLNAISDTLDSIITRISAIKSSIPGDDYLKSGNLLVLPEDRLDTDLTKTNVDKDKNKGFRNALASYLNYIDNNIDGSNGLNSKIENSELKLNIEKLKDIKKVTKIKSKDLDDETNFLSGATVEKNLKTTTIDGNSSISGAIENADDVYEKETDLRTDVFDIVSSRKPSSNVNIGLLDLINVSNEILDKREKVERINKKLKKDIADEFLNEAVKVNLNPTIANLIGILANNAEVFLKTIELVSANASSSDTRKTKLLGAINNLNVGKKSTATDVYPWPEYKEKDIRGIFEETWLGELFNNDENEIKNIPELLFIEELLAGLLKIGREDLERDAFENGVKTPSFYPVSPADSSIILDGNNEFYVKNNPYYNAALIESGNVAGNPEEITRCLLMRGFLAFGISNRIPFEDSDTYPEFLGKMEAVNAFNVITSESKSRTKARDLITAIANEGGGNPESAKDAVIELWKVGTSNVKNPTGVITPLLEESGKDKEKYKYVYIDERKDAGVKRAYLPITDNFDGKVFYKDGKIKTADELKTVSNTVLFTGNYRGDIANSSTNQVTIQNISAESSEGKQLVDQVGVTDPFVPKPGQNVLENFKDDGSVYLKIIDATTYERTNSPQFGQTQFATYDKKGFMRQAELKDLTYDNKPVSSLNRYNSPTKTLEFSRIIYDGDFDSKENRRNTDIDDKEINFLNDISSIYWADSRYSDSTNLQDINQEESRAFGSFLASSLGDNFLSYTDKNKNKLYIDNKDTENTVKLNFGFTNSDISVERTLRPKNWGQQKEIITSNKGYLPSINFALTNNTVPNETISLFGSTFYYGQDDVKAKAFLFLHSFSWQGVKGDIIDYTNKNSDDVSIFDIFDSDGDSFEGEDETYSIKGIFSTYGAHIKAPKMWCAYIGSLLYRLDTWLTEGKDIIKFKDGNTMFIPRQKPDSYTPTPLQYLRYGNNTKSPGISLFFDGFNTVPDDKKSDTHEGWSTIDRGIVGLPQQVRTEFKKIFLEFVEGVDGKPALFEQIRKDLELFDNLDDKKKKWKEIENVTIQFNNNASNKPAVIQKFNIASLRYGYTLAVKSSDILTIFKDKSNIANYYNVAPKFRTLAKNTYYGISDGSYGFKGEWWKDANDKSNVVFPEFELLMKNDTIVMNRIVNYMKTPVYITNIKPDIFRTDFQTTTLDLLNQGRNDIEVSKNNMDKYLTSFFTEFKRLSQDWTKNGDDDKLKKRLFNTIDNDIIKLNLYRTIASIYNKWIAGGSDKCIRLDRLAETFKYLDKDFRNIGDKFYINPVVFSNRITSNYNQNFFDVANRTLSDNNFNFIPLPSFIDFTNEKELKDVFKPFPYKEAITYSAVSPSFVCVYIGQTSTNLAIDGSETPDDGFSISIDENGNPISTPPGFGPDDDGGAIPYFLVNYGQQNQSIFKDVKLDQREFTETAESLEIIEDLSRNANDGTKKGVFNSQNLFNVYQKRSYSAQVEMMGNAMIQPMMYFQLNNIPMFRGAYLIISVNHSLSPNNMTTSFKGVRVKGTKTKLINKEDFYISLIGDTSNAGEASAITVDVVNDEDYTVDGQTITDLNFSDPLDNMLVTSPVGQRRLINPPGASKEHKGLDLNVEYGKDNIKSVKDGVIEYIRLRKGYGLQVQILHGELNNQRWRSFYAHLSDISKTIKDLDKLTPQEKAQLTGAGLVLNKKVKKDEIIGVAGGRKGLKSINGVDFAGTSSGPHLHFEIRAEDKNSNGAFDPSPVTAYINNSTPKDPAILVASSREVDSNNIPKLKYDKRLGKSHSNIPPNQLV